MVKRRLASSDNSQSSLIACWSNAATDATSSQAGASAAPPPEVVATRTRRRVKQPAAKPVAEPTPKSTKRKAPVDQPKPQVKRRGRPKSKPDAQPSAQPGATDQLEAMDGAERQATAQAAPEAATTDQTQVALEAATTHQLDEHVPAHVLTSPLDDAESKEAQAAPEAAMTAPAHVLPSPLGDAETKEAVVALSPLDEGGSDASTVAADDDMPVEADMFELLASQSPQQVVSQRAAAAVAPAAQLDPDLGPVSCTHDVMRWPTANVKRMTNPSEALNTVCEAISATGSLATLFSGVTADHVALNMGCAQWERMKASVGQSCTPIKRPRYIAAVDKDVECQHELQCVPHGPEKIYSDMKDFGTAELLEKLSMEKLPYCADRIAAMCTETGAVKTHAKCIKTNKVCKFERPDGVIAGIPCTDWTLWGQGRKLTGPTCIVTMITLAFLNLLLPFWILIENVATFDEDVVRRYLGRHYTIEAVLLDNLDFGLTVRRVRKYIVLTLKTVMTLTRPLADLTPTFGRERCSTYNWRNILSASNGELWSEILWSQRRTVGEKPQADTSRAPTEKDFLDALLDTERDRTSAYVEQHDVGECVLSLGQNPEFGKCASGTEVLHTLVRSVHIQWIPSMGRWMTCREMLLAQSFPTTNSALASALGLESSDSVSALTPLCSFNVSRPAFGLPARQRTAMAHQAGNTMCTNVCGSVLTWLFLYLKKAHVQNVPSPLSVSDSPLSGMSTMSLFESLRDAAKRSHQSFSGTSSLAGTLSRAASSQSLGTESAQEEQTTVPTFFDAFKSARMLGLGRCEEL